MKDVCNGADDTEACTKQAASFSQLTSLFGGSFHMNSQKGIPESVSPEGKINKARTSQ